MTSWKHEIIRQAHNVYFGPDVESFLYVKYTDEWNNSGSFVACDVSTGRNERWLRGGVHVSPPSVSRWGALHRGTLEGAFVLVDSPPLALLSSFDHVRLLALYLTLCLPSWVWRGRRHVQDCAGRDQSIPFTSSVSPRRAIPTSSSKPPPPPPPPQDPQWGDRR